MLTLQTTRAQEIRVESLDDGPGLLPFKLGPMRHITHYHTFLQYIDLEDIENKIFLVKIQLQQISMRLQKNSSLHDIQLEHLFSKLNKSLNQLKSLEPRRVKRGLIDGLGSVIKSVTGNLDYTDAIKYNDAISTLTNNENNIVTELNNHISLSKDWMAKHTEVIDKLVENQMKINKSLELLVHNGSQMGISLIKYTKISQFLSIISENVDDLLTELYRIENILGFIRSSSTHHSMLEVDVMSNILRKLKNIYGKDQILDVELRDYYDIIKPGYYYSENTIIIIYGFPILSPNIYILYKLAILPNKYNETIIPPYPMIAINNNSYLYIEAECPKLQSIYLCDEKLNHQVRTDPDCIRTLIDRKEITKFCKPTTITLLKEAMEKLDDRYYSVVFPKRTNVQLICGREDHVNLRGSYLISIPRNCLLRTREFTIINTRDDLKGEPLKIMSFSTQIDDENLLETPRETIKLNTINLDSLHEIQGNIELQTPVHLDKSTLYHTTIPFYGLIFGATVFITIFLIIRRKKLFSKCSKDAVTYPVAENENTENRHEPPATFSLNILK